MSECVFLCVCVCVCPPAEDEGVLAAEAHFSYYVFDAGSGGLMWSHEGTRPDSSPLARALTPSLTLLAHQGAFVLPSATSLLQVCVCLRCGGVFVHV